MKKLLLIFGFAGIVLGAVIFLYDIYFIHRYGVDVNDVACADGRWTVDWPTGERPAYADYPAWSYGIALWLIAAGSLTVRAFLPEGRRKPSKSETPARSS